MDAIPVELDKLEGSLAPCEVIDADLFTGLLRYPAGRVNGVQPRVAWILVRSMASQLVGLLFRCRLRQWRATSQRVLETLFENQLLRERSFLARYGRSRTSARRSVADEKGEAITAVVCTTGDRTTSLQRCLESLQRQSYERFNVLVVDNTVSGGARADIDEFADDERFAYVVETRTGLSWARNSAIQAARTPLMAFCDDDEVADEFWLHELVCGFLELPDASVICGYMAPAELRTEAQIWFEQWGGHSKGRGLRQEIFRKEGGQHPLYPLPAFGSGGNMAYRRADLRRIGGFDTALGAGTSAMGAEDTRAFAASLLSGDTMLYRPAAITFHFHRPEVEELARQLRGYGIGLTAFYSSVIASEPRRIVTLAAILPRVLRDLSSDDSLRNRGLSDDFPRSLMKMNRRGMVRGPIAYVRGRLNDRRNGRGGIGRSVV